MDCRNYMLACALILAVQATGCDRWNLIKKNPSPAASQPQIAKSFPQAPLPEKTSWAPFIPGMKEKKRSPKAATMVAFAKLRETNADNATDNQTRVKSYDEARQVYQEAIKAHPKHLDAYRGLARVYLKLSDQDRALETYHQALEKFPKQAELWHDLAMCHNRVKDWNKGVECLDRALAIDPENRKYAQTLGLTLARAGRFDDAIVVLSDSYGPSHAHYTVARMLRHLGDNERCMKHLQQAVQADPQNQRARTLLTALQNPQDNPQAAPSGMPNGVHQVQGVQQSALPAGAASAPAGVNPGIMPAVHHQTAPSPASRIPVQAPALQQVGYVAPRPPVTQAPVPLTRSTSTPAPAMAPNTFALPPETPTSPVTAPSAPPAALAPPPLGAIRLE